MSWLIDRDHSFFGPCPAVVGSGVQIPHKVLLARGRANPVPGVSYLVIMNFRQIVRRVEIQDMNVEASDGAQQRVGRDYAVTLACNQPCARVGQVLLRIENIDRGALTSRGLAPYALERDGGCAYFGLCRRERYLRSFIAHPCAGGCGSCLVSDLFEHHAAL